MWRNGAIASELATTPKCASTSGTEGSWLGWSVGTGRPRYCLTAPEVALQHHGVLVSQAVKVGLRHGAGGGMYAGAWALGTKQRMKQPRHTQHTAVQRHTLVHHRSQPGKALFLKLPYSTVPERTVAH